MRRREEEEEGEEEVVSSFVPPAAGGGGGGERRKSAAVVTGAAAAVVAAGGGPRQRVRGEGGGGGGVGVVVGGGVVPLPREGMSLGETLNAMEGVWDSLMVLGYDHHHHHDDDHHKANIKPSLNRYNFALEATGLKGLSRHQQFQDFVQVSHWLIMRLGGWIKAVAEEDAPLTTTTDILNAAQVRRSGWMDGWMIDGWRGGVMMIMLDRESLLSLSPCVPLELTRFLLLLLLLLLVLVLVVMTTVAWFCE